MTYPTTTGFVQDSSTSEASAAALDQSGSADSQAEHILYDLLQAQTTGMTADELTISLSSEFPKIHNGTVAGRLVHLEKQNFIRKTAMTRKTRSNRQACVYIHRAFESRLTSEQLDITGLQRKRVNKEDHFRQALITARAAFQIGMSPEIIYNQITKALEIDR